MNEHKKKYYYASMMAEDSDYSRLYAFSSKAHQEMWIATGESMYPTLMEFYKEDENVAKGEWTEQEIKDAQDICDICDQE